jgi:superfamily I DNA/RNA helicase
MRKDTKGEPDKKISDAERRVYYVGMTRASEKLIVAEGLIDEENCIPMSHLLDMEDQDKGSGWGANKRLDGETWT